MSLVPATTQLPAKPLTCDEILGIAREDAERVYKDLTRFRIPIFLESDGWHIEYRLTERFIAGGGPNYLIDPDTESIQSKKYYQ
jgi:hypothetical protein